ncbi:MAG: potassium channel protein [Deltaproteobacteria bacterium]|nr:potassium channel protein [Deltaproteobacteria bacterium]
MLFREIYRRLSRALLLLGAVLLVGTFGYHWIGSGAGHDWNYWDCLYMTVITVASVGYTEVFPVRNIPGAEGFTMAVILLGAGAMVYASSVLIALFVEEDLRHVLRRARMRKAIRKMKDHIIVCGTGSTGITVVRELVATKRTFVVIERDAERLGRLDTEFGKDKVRHVQGDATDDDVLHQAGIAHAMGLVTALPTDKDNLFVTVSARQINPKLRIVARAIEVATAPKLLKAGAHRVVSPNAIGGMRMVSELIRPTVVEFLDKMLRDRERNLRIEEVPVPPSSPLVGQPLRHAPIRRITQLLVIAAWEPEPDRYTYNPGPDYVLTAGVVLIVLGEVDDVIKLRAFFETGERASVVAVPPQRP